MDLAPASVRESAMRTFGMAMINSAEGSTIGSSDHNLSWNDFSLMTTRPVLPPLLLPPPGAPGRISPAVQLFSCSSASSLEGKSSWQMSHANTMAPPATAPSFPSNNDKKDFANPDLCTK